MTAVNGRNWSIWRRFSNFDDFHTTLEGLSLENVVLPEFPAKSLFRMADADLEERRARLETWLLEVLSQTTMSPVLRQQLDIFLQPGLDVFKV